MLRSARVCDDMFDATLDLWNPLAYNAVGYVSWRPIYQQFHRPFCMSFQLHLLESKYSIIDVAILFGFSDVVIFLSVLRARMSNSSACENRRENSGRP